MPQLTPRRLQQLLRAHTSEILNQLGEGDFQIGIAVGNPNAQLRVSVLPEQVGRMPRAVTVTDDSEVIQIPLDVRGDFVPYELQASPGFVTGSTTAIAPEPPPVSPPPRREEPFHAPSKAA